MWKEIQILEKSYFIKCSFNSANKVTCILYDHNESWCETLALHEIKRKVKQLNRRFDFNEENIRKTFSSTEGELEMATLEKGKDESLLLKLKYKVMNCPFQYEWSLKKQTLQQFQETFVRPMFCALIGCKEQIDILTDGLRKKDAEILQYRREGAILGRKTLATKLFDFEEFAKKYEARNKIVSDFSELGQLLANSQPERSQQAATNKIEKQEPQEEIKIADKLEATSPGKRKRKVLKQQLLETALNTRAKILEYENSQSQSLSGSQSTEDPLPDENKLGIKQNPDKSESNSPVIKKRRASINVESNEEANKATTSQMHAKKVEANKTTTSQLQTKTEPKSPEKTNVWKPGQRKFKNLPTQQLTKTTMTTGIQYESSSQSQSSEETVTNTKKLVSKDPTVVPENKSQPIMKRSSSRCDPLAEKIEKKANDDKSESESDASVLIAPRRRQSKQLCSQSLDENTDNDDTGKDTERKDSARDNLEETQKPIPPKRDVNKAKGNDDMTFKSPRKGISKLVESCGKLHNNNVNDKEISKEVEEPSTCEHKPKEKLTDTAALKSPGKGISKSDETVENSDNNNLKDKEITKNHNEESSKCEKKSQETLTHVLTTSDSDAVEVIVMTPRRKRRKSLTRQSISTSNSPLADKENTKERTVLSLDISDTESDEEILRTPRKRKNLSLTSRTPEKRSTPSKEKVNVKEKKDIPTKECTDTDEAPQYIVEISTDSECNEPHQTASRLRKRNPVTPESPSMAFSIKSRITRSSPQVLSTPKISDEVRCSMKSPTKANGKNRGASSNAEAPLVIGEISTQLEAIRKELECLEALRLADLKHRTCKA